MDYPFQFQAQAVHWQTPSTDLAGVNSYHCVNGDSVNDKSLRILKMLPLPSFVLTLLASDDSLLFGSYRRLESAQSDSEFAPLEWP